jgi:hypothetical protein
MVPFTTAAHFYRLLAQSFTRWQLNRVQADTADEERAFVQPTHRSAPTHRYLYPARERDIKNICSANCDGKKR